MVSFAKSKSKQASTTIMAKFQIPARTYRKCCTSGTARLSANDTSHNLVLHMIEEEQILLLSLHYYHNSPKCFHRHVGSARERFRSASSFTNWLVRPDVRIKVGVVFAIWLVDQQ